MTTSKLGKSFCFIPAKAASVRLKKKNLLKLKGKELIYYPIQNAIQSKVFDKQDIILSSESTEIKTIAEKHGAHVPYLRDKKLSVDPYGTKDVLLDFLDRFPAYKNYDSAAVILPTSPFMNPSDIQGAYKIYEQGNYDMVMSVSPTEHSALRSVRIADGDIQPIFPEFITKKSGELEPTYRINGAIGIVRIAPFLKVKKYLFEEAGAYVMPPERSVDIDTEVDYRYAQFLMGEQNT